MTRSRSNRNTSKASFQSHAPTSRRAGKRTPLEHNIEHYLADQYLKRIGYVSGPEHGYQKPDPETKSKIRPATKVEIQPMMNPLEEQYTAQALAPSNIWSRPATQSCRSDLREEAWSPCVLSDNPSTTSTPSTKAGYQTMESRQKSMYSSQTPPPSPQTKAERLTNLHSELQRRQKTCLGIERQIGACQKEIQSFPSKQHNIAKENEKRISELVKPENDKRHKKAATEKRRDPQTAEEAKIEEMRDIYLQYDCKSVGVPPRELVDAFFGIIADTEHHVKKAEGANKAAKRREGKLEESLYKARCAVLEMEREIEEVKIGGREASQPRREADCRIGGIREGKKRRKRGKGGRNRR